MALVGLLTFSDGRDFVNRDVGDFVRSSEERIARALEGMGHTVVKARSAITSTALAASEARFVASNYPDLTIFNYPVWAFPNFTMVAASAIPTPLLLLSTIDPKYPGMVGMLAAAGGLDQLGRVHERLWGDIDDVSVRSRLAAVCAGAHGASALKGKIFGRIGGRSMGMYTAVGRTDEWMSKFGIDVEEIDQWEVVRRSELVEDSLAKSGRQWLEKHCAAIHYDGRALTEEMLERQIRSYYAMRDIIEEANLAFCGIKGQPELTTYFATTDILEAFLNDPYDWDGPKEPFVCATEDDMDGALTMQLFKGITGGPVLFADVRHYFADRDLWDLVNSGQHATWFASRSNDPVENLRKVHLYPADFYFPAGGASVHFLAAPGGVTLARLSRIDGKYRLQIVSGEFVEFDEATNENLMQQSTYTWPHAFTKMNTSPEVFLSRFGANHIHAVAGDVSKSMEIACKFLGIEIDNFNLDH